MNPMVIMWLCAFIVFIIIEAVTTQMVCIWFAAAALVTLIAALLGVPELAQYVVYVLTAAVLLIFTRPFVKRVMKSSSIRTNADRTIGMTAIVIKEINNNISEGQVKVSGQTWTARSQNGEVIPTETKVAVRSIEGVKLIVQEIKEDL